MDLTTLGIGAVLAFAVARAAGERQGVAAPPTGGKGATVADLTHALAKLDGDMDRIVGPDVRDDEVHWTLLGDYPDALLYRQLWAPASRVGVDDLTPADLALAIVFLGVVPDAPVLAKGSAAGCPIGNYEKAIRAVNKRFQSEAEAAGGIGEIVTTIVKAFGVDVEQIDESIGLGRAEKEVLKAQFDLSKLQGIRVGDLRRMLAWDTPLSRPVHRQEWVEIVRAKDGSHKEDGTELQTKAGQIFLMANHGKISFGVKGDWWIRDGVRVDGEVRPFVGPAFRPGLFDLEFLRNTPSAGTIDHSTKWQDAGEFALPWNSRELGCVLSLRQRCYMQARIYRACDYLATQLYPLDPHAMTLAPGGRKYTFYDAYGPDALAYPGKGQKLYWYVSPGGIRCDGSIFPSAGGMRKGSVTIAAAGQAPAVQIYTVPASGVQAAPARPASPSAAPLAPPVLPSSLAPRKLGVASVLDKLNPALKGK